MKASSKWLGIPFEERVRACVCLRVCVCAWEVRNSQEAGVQRRAWECKVKAKRKKANAKVKESDCKSEGAMYEHAHVHAHAHIHTPALLR